MNPETHHALTDRGYLWEVHDYLIALYGETEDRFFLDALYTSIATIEVCLLWG